jgi:hypothetical protein
VPWPSARYSALRISSRRLTVRWNSKLPSPWGVKSARLGVGGGEQLYAMLVERVDQGDEPRRFIAHLARHDRDSDEDDGVKALGNREIIRGSARLARSAS